MTNLVAFLVYFLSYFIVFLIILGLAVFACMAGIRWRKVKNAKAEKVQDNNL